MLLTYDYKGQSHKVFIHWTADTGNSTVFREIVQRVSERHQLDPGNLHETAHILDELTDKLYEQIYIFINEHHGVPYNPRFRKVVLRALSEVSDKAEETVKPDCFPHEHLLTGLFNVIVDKLRETVDIYLAENAYQGKHRYHKTHFLQYSENTDENMMIYEFEDVLLQMTEIARIIDCLTDIQRNRFVKHIFLNFTFKEIAEQECVSKQSVRESIVAALKKIRQRLD